MTEPFAWFRYQQGSRVYYDTKKWDDCQPLYTSPPQQEPVAYWKEHAQGLQRDYDSLLADFQAQRTWVGLTDEDQFNLVHAMNENDWDAVQFLEAADAKLKEKNHG